jgi:ribose-phosphate pyrophosphokinase
MQYQVLLLFWKLYYNRYMKVFSGSANKSLAEKIAKHLSVTISPIELHTFPDGEQRVMLGEGVVDEDVVLVQPTGIPTDTNYMQLFFMIDAAKRNGAKSITVIIPYLGYARQDHVFRTGEARSLEAVIRTLESLGATRFVGVDCHSIKIPELFKIETIHITALPLFAHIIKQQGWLDNDTFLVSPDMGGIGRVEKLSGMLSDMPHAAVEKNRDLVTGSLDASIIHGDVKKRALIVDDMISSGGTIETACNLLAEKGVQEMIVFATHAVFSDKAPEILQRSKAAAVFVTDTLYLPQDKRFDKVHILSVSEMIASSLQE